jgi:hypothetical protein
MEWFMNLYLWYLVCGRGGSSRSLCALKMYLYEFARFEMTNIPVDSGENAYLPGISRHKSRQQT